MTSMTAMKHDDELRGRDEGVEYPNSRRLAAALPTERALPLRLIPGGIEASLYVLCRRLLSFIFQRRAPSAHFLFVEQSLSLNFSDYRGLQFSFSSVAPPYQIDGYADVGVKREQKDDRPNKADESDSKHHHSKN